VEFHNSIVVGLDAFRLLPFKGDIAKLILYYAGAAPPWNTAGRVFFGLVRFYLDAPLTVSRRQHLLYVLRDKSNVSR
jgi:hypothetical protein